MTLAAHVEGTPLITTLVPLFEANEFETVSSTPLASRIVFLSNSRQRLIPSTPPTQSVTDGPRWQVTVGPTVAQTMAK